MKSRRYFVHPNAMVDAETIGDGTRIWAFTHVCRGATVGDNVNIGEHCYIEGGARIGSNVTIKNGVMLWEGVRVEDDAFIGPGVVFTNDLSPRSPRFGPVRLKYRSKEWLLPTVVERGASIGANATICPGIRIGGFAMIGAGSVVTHTVAAHEIVFGAPARSHGFACVCGQKLRWRKQKGVCPQCNRHYRKMGKVVTLLDSV